MRKQYEVMTELHRFGGFWRGFRPFRQDEARMPFSEGTLRASAWLHRPISSYEASIPLSKCAVRHIVRLHLGETELEGVSSDCFPASISISAM
jgi:hypothetical protein